jgi:hypothetical protein
MYAKLHVNKNIYATFSIIGKKLEHILIFFSKELFKYIIYTIEQTDMRKNKAEMIVEKCPRYFKFLYISYKESS